MHWNDVACVVISGVSLTATVNMIACLLQHLICLPLLLLLLLLLLSLRGL